ncbi:selenoprotein T [Lycorma delicatula]|uniref:selenoprotein T n=1 Tax=Lycorma delicatula TaxID=130591 RepID=UPI003F513B65
MVNYARIACGGIFLIFAVFTFRDIFVDSSTPEKEIPATKVGFNANVGPTLKFLFCYSCGYRKLFDDYTIILQQKYPEISIQGGNYDPPSHYMLLVKILAILRIMLIFCILCGVNVFQYLRVQEQSWWSWCLENKLYSCVMIFFLCNALEGHLISTGAFEITLNDMPVWSKLETGRIPQPPELFQIIDNQLRFDEQIDMKRNFPKL